MNNIKLPKVIFSSYDDLKNPYYAGGGALAVHEVAKRLVSKYDVTVYTSKYPKSKNENVDGVQYTRIGLPFLGPYLGQLWFQLSLPFYVNKLNFDIWIENFTPPFSTALLPLFTSKKVIGQVHMLSGEDMKRKYLLPFDFFEKHGLKTYQEFITVTDFLKNKIQLVNKDANISVIPNGINLTDVKKTETKNYILYLGRIEVNQKGLDLLIEAFNKIKNATDLKLIVAGNGTPDNVNKFKKLINDYKLNDRVEYVGRVESEAKNKLIRESICLILPSRFESFGIVALEAFSCKKGVICFDLNMLNWIPNQCSLKAAPFDINSLAQNILKISGDRKLQLSIGNSGRKFVEAFNWDQISNQYILRIESIFNSQEIENSNNSWSVAQYW